MSKVIEEMRIQTLQEVMLVVAKRMLDDGVDKGRDVFIHFLSM